MRKIPGRTATSMLGSNFLIDNENPKARE